MTVKKQWDKQREAKATLEVICELIECQKRCGNIENPISMALQSFADRFGLSDADQACWIPIFERAFNGIDVLEEYNKLAALGFELKSIPMGMFEPLDLADQLGSPEDFKSKFGLGAKLDGIWKRDEIFDLLKTSIRNHAESPTMMADVMRDLQISDCISSGSENFLFWSKWTEELIKSEKDQRIHNNEPEQPSAD